MSEIHPVIVWWSDSPTARSTLIMDIGLFAISDETITWDQQEDADHEN